MARTSLRGAQEKREMTRRAARTHLPAAGHLHAVHGPRDLDGAHAAVLAALLADVLQDLLVVVVVHQLLGHHHVEEAQHLGGQPRVLQPLQPGDLQRHRGLHDGRLMGADDQKPMVAARVKSDGLTPPPVSEADVTHRVAVFGSHAGALHDQLLVAQLHPVEPGDRLLQEATPAGETRYDRQQDKRRSAALGGT